jgi:methenyltetrahydrofolate cyclohydrolase
MEPVADQGAGSWLDDLASAAPAPGGGAAAAMLAAIGAALVSMVCELTVGKPRYAEHEDVMRAALASAAEFLAEARRLADADAVAFGAVSEAYRRPKGTEAERAARTEAIQVALVGAAGVPLRTAAVAAGIIELSERILPGANVNVLSDVAVAASSARAALEAAEVNVEINVAALRDPAGQAALRAELAGFAPAAAVADRVVAAVRERIGAGPGG